MKGKIKVKMGVDLLMTVLLLTQMGYQIIGQEFHEWFGTTMLAMFVVHNFLNIRWYGNLLEGRMMHVAASQWGFVLMSIHLGFHWGMIGGMLGKLLKGMADSLTVKRGLRGLAVLIAGYGLYLFIRKDMVSYMFLRNEFVYFDFEKSGAAVFAEYMAMMGFWAWISFYGSRLVFKKGGRASKRVRQKDGGICYE